MGAAMNADGCHHEAHGMQNGIFMVATWNLMVAAWVLKRH
jgi:hypothetical protein